MLSNDPKYIAYRDLIGLNVWIKQKNQKNMKDFIYAGVVIDESYNLIITSKENNSKNNKKKIKKYVKKNTIFRVEIPNNNDELLEIDGIKLLKRPEDRIKQLKKSKRRL